MQSTASSPSSRAKVRNTTLLVVVLTGLWLAFSGKLDALHLGYGVLSIVLVVVLTRSLVVAQRDPVENEAIGRIHWGRAAVYTVWLVVQIIVANVQVTLLILNPRLPVRPALIEFRTGFRSSLAKTALGNSITLTPGTFTLHVRDDLFLIHTIHEGLAGSVIDGSMARKVAALFGEDVVDDLGVRVIRDEDEVRKEVERWSS